jgi:hypothetical protein
MKKWYLWVVLVAILLGCETPARAAEPKWDGKVGPLIGYVHKGYVYAAARGWRGGHHVEIHIWGREFDGEGFPESSESICKFLAHLTTGSYYRWRVAEGCFWETTAGGFSCDDGFRQLRLFEMEPYLIKKNGKTDPLALGGGIGAADPEHDWFVRPVEDKYGPLSDRLFKKYTKELEGVEFASLSDRRELAYNLLKFDFVPVGEESCLAFVLQEKQMTVYRADKRLPPDRSLPSPWKEIESYPTHFQEPFTAYRSGDDHFFVTLGGNLYMAPKPAQGKKRLAALNEFDGDRPVAAIITDSDAGKTFVFTRAADRGGKEERGAYLLLDGKSKPVRYDLKRVKPVKADEPLKSVIEYTMVLIADKAITVAPPK